MGSMFWLKRFVIAFVGAGVLLFAVELVKGSATEQALRFGLLWGLVFAALFTLIGYVRYRRNPACMLPRDRRG